MFGHLLQVFPPRSYPERPITFEDVVGASLAFTVLIIGSMAWGSWQDKQVARRKRRARERVLPFSPKIRTEQAKIRTEQGGVPVNDTSHAMLVASSVSYRTPNDERAFQTHSRWVLACPFGIPRVLRAPQGPRDPPRNQKPLRGSLLSAW